MQQQIDDLQAKIAFQDDAIEEMTNTLVRQQKELYELRQMLIHLQSQMKALAPTQIGSAEEETPPPHY